MQPVTKKALIYTSCGSKAAGFGNDFLSTECRRHFRRACACVHRVDKRRGREEPDVPGGDGARLSSRGTAEAALVTGRSRSGPKVLSMRSNFQSRDFKV